MFWYHTGTIPVSAESRLDIMYTMYKSMVIRVLWYSNKLTLELKGWFIALFGIHFGINSFVALLPGGGSTRDTLPSVVYYPEGGGEPVVGVRAQAQGTGWTDGASLCSKRDKGKRNKNLANLNIIFLFEKRVCQTRSM